MDRRRVRKPPSRPLVLIIDGHGPTDGVIPSRRRVPGPWATGSITVQIAVRHEDVFGGHNPAGVQAAAGVAPVRLLDDLRWKALEAGADWFMLRPLSVIELQTRVSDLVRSGRPRLRAVASQRRLPRSLAG